MRCVKPYIKNGVHIPCGKCMACRITKSVEWSNRIRHEMEYYKEMCFITLTYDEEHLPEDESLHKPDLQKFFKRLRANTKKDIKYFACGEYGEDLGRPHYHAIILGVSLLDPVFDTREFRELSQPQLRRSKIWTNGFVHVGTVTPDSVRYVTDYVKKKLTGRLGTETYGSKESPFQLVSQGLGKRYVLNNMETLLKHQYFSVQGVRFSLPRYYKKHLGIEGLAGFMTPSAVRAFMKDLARHVTRMERTGSMDKTLCEQLRMAELHQLEKNIVARSNLHKKPLDKGINNGRIKALAENTHSDSNLGH